MTQTDFYKTPRVRALIALNVILGVLIIAGVGGIIVTAVSRLRAPVNSAAPIATHIRAPGEHLAGMQADGSRLLLHLTGPNGDEIVVLDQNFKVLGRITVGP
ncbi:MAG: hypothetical protein KGO48_01015 [Alphaproteobacteria bacterium]|nr:hypothetical protein [Alphaproteobacteria bacterium]